MGQQEPRRRWHVLTVMIVCLLVIVLVKGKPGDPPAGPCAAAARVVRDLKRRGGMAPGRPRIE